MKQGELQVGEIVQVNPSASRGIAWFGACLVVVTEVKPWGCQGYVKNAGSAGLAFIRLRWDEFETTGGIAQWQQADEVEEAGQ